MGGGIGGEAVNGGAVIGGTTVLVYQNDLPSLGD